jgi:hypothetical protein
MDAETVATLARLREAANGLRSVGLVPLAEQVEALAEKMARSQLASKAPRTTRMNFMVQALVATALALLLLAGSIILFSEIGTAPDLLQLLD